MTPFFTAAQKFKDTLFFYKSPDDSGSQLVFIDTPFSNFHQKVYNRILSSADQKAAAFLAKNANNAWISVKLYKGRYYVYYPSEVFVNVVIAYNGTSLLYNDFSDGFVFCPVVKTIKPNATTVYFKDSFNKKQYVKFEKISQWVYSVNSTMFAGGKEFFIKLRDLEKLPIIINLCPERCSEFQF
jgi:hypothetical protein